ncbi:hypothetical protein BGZ95_010390 [Linnemannia exigua]|uniref:Uncharacterized protein n=1 Tax=Linnemannia exigua TaxID=604196 RepID=A0AAD4H764_9FUNG|nr:hypothetical protein BGZ95_010390 [Linnemannia exigua]
MVLVANRLVFDTTDRRYSTQQWQPRLASSETSNSNSNTNNNNRGDDSLDSKIPDTMDEGLQLLKLMGRMEELRVKAKNYSSTMLAVTFRRSGRGGPLVHIAELERNIPSFSFAALEVYFKYLRSRMDSTTSTTLWTPCSTLISKNVTRRSNEPLRKRRGVVWIKLLM